MTQAPHLLYSPLGRRIYIVTRYTLRKLHDNTTILVAQRKYDVTEEFKALRRKRVRLK